MLFMFNTINLIKDIGILENLVRQSKSRGEGFNSHLTIQDLVRSALLAFTEHTIKFTTVNPQLWSLIYIINSSLITHT